MTRDDFGTLWKMLTGVWPKLDNDETIAAWWGLLGHYPAHHATSAVRKWATERRSAPAPADIIDGIKLIAAESRQVDRRAAIGAPRCDECDSTGFVWLSFDGHGTVKRCRRGCLPPAEHVERPNTERGDATRWAQRLADIRNANAEKLRELGERRYLEWRGYDAAEFRVSHGMVVRRHAPKSPMSTTLGDPAEHRR